MGKLFYPKCSQTFDRYPAWLLSLHLKLGVISYLIVSISGCKSRKTEKNAPFLTSCHPASNYYKLAGHPLCGWPARLRGHKGSGLWKVWTVPSPPLPSPPLPCPPLPSPPLPSPPLQPLFEVRMGSLNVGTMEGKA